MLNHHSSFIIGYYYYLQNQSGGSKKILTPVPALDGNSFKPFVLDEIIQLTHNTNTFRYAITSFIGNKSHITIKQIQVA
jgi:hypothetical protein